MFSFLQIFPTKTVYAYVIFFTWNSKASVISLHLISVVLSHKEYVCKPYAPPQCAASCPQILGTPLNTNTEIPSAYILRQRRQSHWTQCLYTTRGNFFAFFVSEFSQHKNITRTICFRGRRQNRRFLTILETNLIWVCSHDLNFNALWIHHFNVLCVCELMKFFEAKTQTRQDCVCWWLHRTRWHSGHSGAVTWRIIQVTTLKLLLNARFLCPHTISSST